MKPEIIYIYTYQTNDDVIIYCDKSIKRMAFLLPSSKTAVTNDGNTIWEDDIPMYVACGELPEYCE